MQNESSYTVVVVDDNNIAVQAIVQSTNWIGMKCTVVGTASNGITGLEVICLKKPDIVITDIKMPGYDGLQMIRQMQANGSKSRYIIISGYNDFIYAQKAIQLGVSDFLLKPVLSRDLEKAVRTVISQINGNPQESDDFDRLDMRLHEIQSRREQYSVIVSDALKFIDQSIHKEVTLSQTAEKEGISPAYFSKLFKKETGIGFTTYTTLVKMCRARVLLQNPKNKAYEVANMLGYCDYTYFFQVFKKYFGYSPGDKLFCKK